MSRSNRERATLPGVRACVFAVLMLAFAVPAHADDIVAYEAEGDAAATGADPRTAALDDAFARAVSSALVELVAGDVRTAHKGELDREIVAHSRLWVAKFAVTKDEVDDDRRQLTVSVRIDRDKLRARLGELKIPTHDAVAPESAAPTDPSQRTVTILVRVSTPRAIRAGFGKGAQSDVDGVAKLTTLFRSAGMAVRRAPDSAVIPSGQGDFPISDADAEALGDLAKADLVAVAGITVGDAVPVRGQAALAVLVTAHLELIDRKDHQVVRGVSVAASAPDDARYAIDRALAAAAADVLPAAPKKLVQAATWNGNDTPLAEPGVVLLRMSSKTPYALVLAEQKYLAGAKGIRAASLRRLSPTGWVLGVTTSEPIDRIAQIAKKSPTADTSTTVKIVGSVVEVAVMGVP